jgi:hypothetical protein
LQKKESKKSVWANFEVKSLFLPMVAGALVRALLFGHASSCCPGTLRKNKPATLPPMNVQALNTLQQTHTAVWNEKDRRTRDTLMQTIYADDIKMYDKDFILTGIPAIKVKLASVRPISVV